jgi:hypothetical protein
VKELLQRLKVAKVTELTPFEALVHVKIAHGVPVMTDLVSVRNRSNYNKRDFGSVCDGPGPRAQRTQVIGSEKN